MLRNPTRRFKLAIAIRYITVAAINRTAGGNQGGTGSQVHPSILQYPRSQARNNKNPGEICLDSLAHCHVIVASLSRHPVADPVSLFLSARDRRSVKILGYSARSCVIR